MEQKRKKALKASSTIKNNLHYCRNDFLGASEIKFYLKQLKAMFGVPESFIQIECIRYALMNDPRYSSVKDELIRRWKDEEKRTLEMLEEDKEEK